MFESRATLIPVEDFEDDRLVDAAHQLAVATNTVAVRRELHSRHLWTATKAFATPRAATANLRKAVMAAREGEFFTYLRTTPVGEVTGAATLIPALPLRRLRINMPPYRLLRAIPGLVVEDPVPESVGSPNVTAWTGEVYPTRQTDELTQMYAGLLVLAGEHGSDAVWTAEPSYGTRTFGPSYAIEQAGLIAVRSGLYDDGEPNRHLVDVSDLFVFPPPSPSPKP